jgi:hypothetical protein
MERERYKNLNTWIRRSKKYRKAVLEAMKALYGDKHDDKDCQNDKVNEVERSTTNRRT